MYLQSNNYVLRMMNFVKLKKNEVANFFLNLQENVLHNLERINAFFIFFAFLSCFYPNQL